MPPRQIRHANKSSNNKQQIQYTRIGPTIVVPSPIIRQQPEPELLLDSDTSDTNIVIEADEESSGNISDDKVQEQPEAISTGSLSSSEPSRSTSPVSSDIPTTSSMTKESILTRLVEDNLDDGFLGKLVDEDQDFDEPLGHSREPIMPRDQTFFDSLSRTIRTFNPNTKGPMSPSTLARLPTSTGSFSFSQQRLPSPPSVSRPVSFGLFTNQHDPSGASGLVSSAYPGPGKWRGGNADQQLADNYYDSERAKSRPSVIDESDTQGFATSEHVATTDTEEDPILWARWDSIGERRLILIGYSAGLQIWDCTSLAHAEEILNLHSVPGNASGAVITYAGVIPSLADSLIGIVTSDALSIYSLIKHVVIKQIAFPQGEVVSFSCGQNVIIVSTSSPPALHVLDPATFAVTHAIPGTQLFTHLNTALTLPLNDNNNPNLNIISSNIYYNSSGNKNNNNSNTISLDSDSIYFGKARHEPVYAVSGRLLAFASTAPMHLAATNTTLVSTTPPSAPSTSTAHHSVPTTVQGGSALKAGSAAALKLGGTMFSGMKNLGGMAINAAFESASATAAGVKDAESGTGKAGGILASGVSRFFSRSAPAASHIYNDSTTTGNASPTSYDLNKTPRGEEHEQKGYWVTILDLGRDFSETSHSVVTQFQVSKDQPITMLAFSADGTQVLVSTKQGQVAKVFQIRPSANELFTPPFAVPGTEGTARANAHNNHLYDLRRGRTSAMIQGMDWSRDGRWIALGTKKRTIHLFAVNPYGGKPDLKSHVDGVVRNSATLQPLSTEVSPLVRLRVQKMPRLEDPKVPLVFKFISASEAEVCLPLSLLPPMTSTKLNYTSPSTSPSNDYHRHPEQTSPSQYHRQANVQDVLVFDPTDGIISLRRFTIDTGRPRRASDALVSGLSMTSVSLPVAGIASRLGVSPPVSGLTRMMEPAAEELTASRETILATWPLRRQRGWGEVKRVVNVYKRPQLERRKSSDETDWLAQAELSTCSNSAQILPRSIYLSHQFSFHTLGEDYHALIRQFQLGIVGSKIIVRAQVEVSGANATMGFGGNTNNVNDDFPSSPTSSGGRRAYGLSSSSFDEPLASALSGGLDYSLPTPILPMLPNGSPNTGGISFPIRGAISGLGEMSESLGRMQRNMHHRVLSPRLKAKADNSMPLVFNEEDEREDEFLEFRNEDDGFVESDEFLLDGMDMDDSAGAQAPPTAPVQAVQESVVEPTHVAEEDIFDGWGGGSEDRRVVDDQEQFDHIAAVGYLDEDVPQQTVVAEQHRPKGRKAAKKKERKRGGM